MLTFVAMDVRIDWQLSVLLIPVHKWTQTQKLYQNKIVDQNGTNKN
jgi:hypothetical protein